MTNHISERWKEIWFCIYSYIYIMHVLLLEDTVDIAEAIRDYLEAMDYRVSRVQTLAESYAVLRQEHFDVAVIDRMLPDGE